MSLRSLALLSLCVVLTACSKINQENYSKIKAGMSKAEVEQLLEQWVPAAAPAGLSGMLARLPAVVPKDFCARASPAEARLATCSSINRTNFL